MKSCTRTFWLAILSITLLSGISIAQHRRMQTIPLQNGGPAISPFHHPSINGPKKIDPYQSRYTWTELDPLGTGAGYCYADAHALNNSDQVVVDWSDPNDCNSLHASLWDEGKWKLLDYPVDQNCAEPTTYIDRWDRE